MMKMELKQAIVKVLRPFASIADAYERNALHGDARRFIGDGDTYENRKPHDKIEICSGRHGKPLLTLADCMAAREAIAKIVGQL